MEVFCEGDRVVVSGCFACDAFETYTLDNEPGIVDAYTPGDSPEVLVRFDREFDFMHSGLHMYQDDIESYNKYNKHCYWCDKNAVRLETPKGVPSDKDLRNLLGI